jgi:acyl carrier protein
LRLICLSRGDAGLPSDKVSEAEISSWCMTQLAKTIDNPAIAITPEATFAEMGLDSASSAYFIVELEDWLGLELPPELVFDYPTITQLARYLVERQGEAGDGGPS